MLMRTVVLLITFVRVPSPSSQSAIHGTTLTMGKGVDDGRKRHRSDEYIYQRRTQQSSLDADGKARRGSPREVIPVIHSSKQGDSKTPVGKASSPEKLEPEAEAEVPAQNETKPTGGSNQAPATPVEARVAPKSSSSTEPRRFHYSRSLLSPLPLATTGLGTGKRSRINTSTTIFVERGHKRTRTEDVHMQDADSVLVRSNAETDEPPKKLKRPGADRKGPTKPAVLTKTEVPPSVDRHWADNMDEITQNMNNFALQVIGENLARTEERDRREAAAAAKKEAASAASPQKFKPKPPARRYAERHPEVAAMQQQQQEEETKPATASEGYETASEDEYVVETYVRVPASLLHKGVDPDKVGLLVFDNEPDADYFYGQEGDSDDEWPEDDEDENGQSPVLS